MFTILFEGWTRFPHSYCVVNINQLAIMASMKDEIKLYTVEKPPFSPSWHLYDSLENIILNEEEAKLLASIEVWDGQKPIDVIWRSWFPYDSTPANVPVALQYTAEFRSLKNEWLTHGTVDELKRRCASGSMMGITPSGWNIPGLGDSGNSVVVPHGCDVTKFFPFPEGGANFRKCLRIPENAFVFLNVGAMTGNKNVRGILYSFYCLACRDQKFWLVLKGIDSLYTCRKNIDLMIHNLAEAGFIDRAVWDRVSSRVVYLDGVMNYKSLNDIYNAADCYLTPYSAEGFNIPALEVPPPPFVHRIHLSQAQACGIPIIATAGGPTDEFLSHEGSTIFVPSTMETTEETVQNGKRLMVKNTDLVATMLECVEINAEMKAKALTVGVEYVRDNFTWKHATDKLLAALRALVAKNVK